MRASIWAHLLLVSSAAAQVSSSVSLSTITAAPSLPESGVPAALIGSQYISQLGTSTTYYCPVGQIWSTKGQYAACCTNDPFQECRFAISCESTSLLVGPGGDFTLTCSGTSSQTVCVTGLVYESTSGTAALTNVQCWPTWDGGSWVATKAASTAPSTLATTTSSRASNFPSLTATPATTGNLPSQTGQPSGSSPVPIGAVVGGVIGGLALMAFLGVCLWFTCSIRAQETRRKWSSKSSIFNSIRWGTGSDQPPGSDTSDIPFTKDQEIQAINAPEVLLEADGTSKVMVNNGPNEGGLPMEMDADAAQTTKQGTDDDAASATSAASFQSAPAHRADD